MRNKYNAKKTEVDGHKFDSIKETRRYTELCILWRAGEIFWLELQQSFELIPSNDKFRSVKYIADFVYTTKEGETVVEDVKGYRKGAAYQIFKIKQKLMYQVHGILVIET